MPIVLGIIWNLHEGQKTIPHRCWLFCIILWVFLCQKRLLKTCTILQLRLHSNVIKSSKWWIQWFVNKKQTKNTLSNYYFPKSIVLNLRENGRSKVPIIINFKDQKSLAEILNKKQSPFFLNIIIHCR